MRIASFLLAGLLASLFSQNRAPSAAPACTTATDACTEWVSLGGGPARSMIYRSRSLTARNENVRRALANKSVFPGMRAIVVAGHSAGGQFVARYQMSNRVHDSLGVPITYVVANPSSYAWPDATRPQPTGDAAPDSAKGAWETENVHT